MSQVVIDGIEYVPRAEVPELSDARLKAALEILTESNTSSKRTRRFLKHGMR